MLSTPYLILLIYLEPCHRIRKTPPSRTPIISYSPDNFLITEGLSPPRGWSYLWHSPHVKIAFYLHSTSTPTTMSSIDRDASRESERRLKHQSSSSLDCGRAIVPMYDGLLLEIETGMLILRAGGTALIQNAHHHRYLWILHHQVLLHDPIHQARYSLRMRPWQKRRGNLPISRMRRNASKHLPSDLWSRGQLISACSHFRQAVSGI